MTNDVYKKREDILKRVINRVIIPRHPDIEGVWVWSQFYGRVRRYYVHIKNNGIPLERRCKMEDEIKSLFKMCGLNANNRQNGRDYVVLHFSGD